MKIIKPTIAILLTIGTQPIMAATPGICTTTTTLPNGFENPCSTNNLTLNLTFCQTTTPILVYEANSSTILGVVCTCGSCVTGAFPIPDTRMGLSSPEAISDKCSNAQDILSNNFVCYCGINQSHCDSTNVTQWSSYATGYQSKRYYKFEGCGCTETQTINYRCADGYYGESTDGTTGCAQCPEWAGVYTDAARTVTARGTSPAGATAITRCYIPTGTYYDASGTFTITSNDCKYTL